MLRYAIAFALLLVAAIAPASGEALGASIPKTSPAVTWSKTVVHLDWATMTRVTYRHRSFYPIRHPKGRVIGYTVTRTRKSPHVVVVVRYPRFAQPVPSCSINPAVGPTVTRWAADICPIAARTGISSRIIAAEVFVESSGLPCETSTDGYGSIGLMQLLPSTAASIMGVSYSVAQASLCDPYWNILAGALYLRYLLYTFAGGNLTTAIAMYNGGPGNPQYGYAAWVLSYA